MNMLYKSRRH